MYHPMDAASIFGTVLPFVLVYRRPVAGSLVYTGRREVPCSAGKVGLLPVKEGELAGRAAAALLLLLFLLLLWSFVNRFTPAFKFWHSLAAAEFDPGVRRLGSCNDAEWDVR